MPGEGFKGLAAGADQPGDGEHAVMRQIAPDPEPLQALVDRLDYRSRQGWKVWLQDLDRGQGSEGLTLVVQRCGPDTYDPDRMLPVNHYFIVPAAAYDFRSWQRWLFDRLGDVDTHERMEFFILHDSPGSEHVTRPYAPSHGPGNDPYLVREVGTQEDVETTFRGEHSPQPGVTPPVIGAGLALELEGYRGQWVAVVDQHVVASADSAAGADANADHPDPLIFRVPMALGAFLGIGR